MDGYSGEINQGTEKIDRLDLVYEKEEYDEIFSDDCLDKTSEYKGPGREKSEMYQCDQSEGESSPASYADTAGEISFEDDLEEFSMTAGERIGYDQKLGQESFDNGFQENGEYGSIEPPPREHVKPSRVKALLEFLKKGKNIESTQATFDSEDVLNEGYMGEEKASEEAEIIEELEDFFDDQNPSDDLITNAHEELEVFDKDSGASVQFVSDNVSRFEVTPRSDAASRDTGDNRLRKQDVLHASEVLVVNVMSREDDEFSGDDILKSLVENGLVYGEMNIFHRYASQDSEDSVLFSVANILRPGTFDLYNMHEFSTIGISLFLSLPTDVNNLEAFENMIRIAKRICKTLDGLLKDDHRNLMTAQTIEHYRQRIRDFELLQLKTAVSRA
jgi:cell division protein ZipA